MNIQSKKILLIILIIAIGIGVIYATFTSELNTNGVGINRKSKFDIYFENFEMLNEHQWSPGIHSDATKIMDYSITFTTPGNYFMMTFDIVNDGDYDATLSSIIMGPVKCSVNGNENDQSAQNVCENIEYTLKYVDNNTNVSVGDELSSKTRKRVSLKLEYKEFSNPSKLPSDNVTISNLGIELIYEANSEAKVSEDGTTPYTKYPVGKEFLIHNAIYRVINSGTDYVTLIKDEPLTVDEVNANKNGLDGVNHVNRNVQNDPGVASDMNGYGAVVFYSSPTCGYETPESSFNGSTCTDSYSDSDIKRIVDKWADTTFNVNELKKVGGNTARIITDGDLTGALNCTVKSAFPSCIYSLNHWIYNSKYSYWISVTSAFFPGLYSMYEGYYVPTIFYMNGNGDIGLVNGLEKSTIRPVINIYKEYLN